MRHESIRTLALNAATVVISVCVALVLVETIFRLSTGKAVFSLQDWRLTRNAENVLSATARFDPDLGWVNRAGRRESHYSTLQDYIVDLTTIPHGIRRNSWNSSIATHAILAVGDSFTFGSEVADRHSWPAFLERELGEPVMNAGVGGYASDQIILRAEQLIPVLEPHTIVIGFLQEDIERSSYSHYGYPKPYFTFADGDWTQHSPTAADISHFDKGNNALGPDSDAKEERVGRFAPLRYSAVADELLARWMPLVWLKDKRQVFKRVEVDVVELTCMLLERLRARTSSAGTRLVLFLQFGGSTIATADKPEGYVQLVEECARSVGIETVSQFAPLKAIWEKDPDALKDYYVMHDDRTYGHMSPVGNAHAAKLLAAVLSQQPTETTVTPRPPRDVQSGAAMPVYPDLLGHVRSSDTVEAAPTQDGTAVRLTAMNVGEREHYTVIGPLTAHAGDSSLSLKVRSNEVRHVRVQLLDSAWHGVIGNLDLAEGSVLSQRQGLVRLPKAQTASTDETAGGWLSITVSGRFKNVSRYIVLQFMEGPSDASFIGSGQTMEVSAISLK